MHTIDVGTLHDWQETKIWHALKQSTEKEAGDVCTTLQKYMPKIQSILVYAGSSPNDFTLHDSQHGFRVAERMAELMPNETFVNLSIYELALLLFSAYLHDIGMSPKQQMVTSHYNLLLTGEKGELSQAQFDLFETWLGNYDPDIRIPLIKDNKPTLGDLGQASYLVSYYCRSQHVHWCELWIGENLKDENLGTYTQWIDDLKSLCRSHHQGYHDLITGLFDPKPVGRHGFVVHLRYLASVLRIGDILEFDPERTPSIIFQHRSIDPRSAVYWHKDHYVTMIISDGMVTVSATPPDAQIHRAIEIMINDIEEELTIIRRLNDSSPFEHAQFQSAILCHKWVIFPDVRRIIRPLNDSYEYVDGAFRPDTKKLLQLLSGTQLYDKPIVAIRELIQNSFDAIRVLIACERLQRPDPGNPKWEEVYGGLHKVELTLERDETDGRIWLTCEDDGIGMSKRILTDYLLVSGVSRRRDIWKLERQCEKSGFQLGCTGQFGIGVLSYFMIADQVQIYTRRDSISEDADNTNWYFETDGVGSFGELHRVQSRQIGTKIRLRLKNTFTKDILDQYVIRYEKNKTTEIDDISLRKREELDIAYPKNEIKILYNEFFNYLYGVLVCLPCDLRFSLYDPGQSRQSEYFPFGWKKNLDDMKDLALSFEPNREGVLRNKYDLDLKRKITDRLDWNVFVGALPENMGEYRVCIPEFNLETGPAPIYSVAQLKNGQYLVDRLSEKDLSGSPEYICVPRSSINFAWRGMKTEVVSEKKILLGNRENIKDGFSTAIVEINWINSEAGELSVSREKFIPSEKAIKALNWLILFVDNKMCEYAIKYSEVSLFAVFGYYLQNSNEIPDHLSKRWLQFNPEISLIPFFGDIKFPAICVNDNVDLFGNGISYKWRDRFLTNLIDVDGVLHSWIVSNVTPSKILCIYMLGIYLPIPVWEDWSVKNKTPFVKQVRTCEFPLEWFEVIAIGGGLFGSDNGLVWNKEHLLSKILDPDLQKLNDFYEINKVLRKKFPDFSFDKVESLGDVFNDQREAVLLFLYILSDDGLLKEAVKHPSGIFEKLWTIVFNKQKIERIIFIDNRVVVVTPKEVKEVTLFRMLEIIPRPGDEWLIAFELE